MMDQARPVATSARLSEAGVRWALRRAREGDMRPIEVYSVLKSTGGAGARFYERLLTAPTGLFEMLRDALDAEDRIRWGR